jgi:hypothetical protein
MPCMVLSTMRRLALLTAPPTVTIWEVGREEERRIKKEGEGGGEGGREGKERVLEIAKGREKNWKTIENRADKENDQHPETERA